MDSIKDAVQQAGYRSPREGEWSTVDEINLVREAETDIKSPITKTQLNYLVSQNIIESKPLNGSTVYRVGGRAAWHWGGGSEPHSGYTPPNGDNVPGGQDPRGGKPYDPFAPDPTYYQAPPNTGERDKPDDIRLPGIAGGGGGVGAPVGGLAQGTVRQIL